MKNRTKWILAPVALVAVTAFGAISRGDVEPVHAAEHAAVAAADAPVITIYKSPTCTCCAEWGEHLKESGFPVELKKVADLNEVKQEHQIPAGFASCHTAVVDGYVLEGHVPADVVHQLLAERPQIRGLTVPGMPAGVPGMPDAGPNRRPFQIFAMEHGGGTHLYATR